MTSTPTLTPLPVIITIGEAEGAPGDVDGFAVTIDTREQNVAEAELCIGYDASTPINAVGGGPDCTPETSLGGQFRFDPSGCTPGATCSAVCATVSGERIRNGATLFSCRVAIAAGAVPGTYPLTCSNADATDPDGNPYGAECNDGAVVVETRLTGDCNGDGVVTIDELIRGVNIALGLLALDECPAFDTDANGEISINELIQAVNNALST